VGLGEVLTSMWKSASRTAALMVFARALALKCSRPFSRCRQYAASVTRGLHSARRLRTGSDFAARSAGTTHATNPVAASVAITTPMIEGSVG
jgi:hypothetical protein